MEEKECRVCRDIGTEDHPLYAPCSCHGSILYCHQDCLEEWLKRSGKNKCELCGIIYKFKSKYAPNVPDTIPVWDFITGGVTTIVKQFFPICLRICLAIFAWLGFVPLITSLIYFYFMIEENESVAWTDFHFFRSRNDFQIIFGHIASGILLTCLIILSCIVLVRDDQ
jgi:E3 ubiquitin-protein ligase MARCH6